MSKDGPPISGGFRYGGVEALRAGLPASAANPKSNPTEKELKARQNLADFSAYLVRTKSIGKPLPITKGVSKRRAAVQKKIAQLKEIENKEQSIVLVDGDPIRIKLIWSGDHRCYKLLKEDLARGIGWESPGYSSARRAKRSYSRNQVRWKKPFNLT